MSTDAIVVLKEDHARIRKLFKEFQQAGDRATKSKEAIVKRIIEELTVHTYLENEVMYPRVRAMVPALEEDTLESYEEHHLADVLCFELFTMNADDERFEAKTTVLIETVTHHLDQEEQHWFPKVREGLSRKDLQDIGAEMVALRKNAPNSPVQPSALKKAIDAVIR